MPSELAQQDYTHTPKPAGWAASLARRRGYGAARLLGGGIQDQRRGRCWGQMAYGTGQSLAGGRRAQAEQDSQAICWGTTSALSQLINQRGMDPVKTSSRSGGSNIANLLAGYGTADAQTKAATARRDGVCPVRSAPPSAAERVPTRAARSTPRWSNRRARRSRCSGLYALMFGVLIGSVRSGLIHGDDVGNAERDGDISSEVRPTRRTRTAVQQHHTVWPLPPPARGSAVACPGRRNEHRRIGMSTRR